MSSEHEFTSVSYEDVKKYGLMFGGNISTVNKDYVTDSPDSVSNSDEWNTLTSADGIDEPTLFLIMYNIKGESYKNPDTNTQLLIVRRTPLYGEVFGGSILLRTSTPYWIRRDSYTFYKTLSNNFSNTETKTVTGFTFSRKSENSSSAISNVEILFTNDEPDLLKKGKVHYIYIDTFVSVCYVLAKYESIIKLSLSQLISNPDIYSPKGLRKIITKKDDNSININVLKRNLTKFLQRKVEKFAITLKTTIEYNSNPSDPSNPSETKDVYMCFVFDYNENDKTCCTIIYPTYDEEYMFSAKQSVQWRNYINGWEKLNVIIYSSSDSSISISCLTFFNLTITNTIKLKLYEASNYRPYGTSPDKKTESIGDKTGTVFYTIYDMELCNISALPVLGDDTSMSLDQIKSIIFNDTILQLNGDLPIYPFAIFNDSFKIKDATTITDDQKQQLFEYCDYNILTRNYSNCFTFFDTGIIYTMSLTDQNNQTTNCIFNTERTSNECYVKNSDQLVYTINTDRIVVNSIPDSLASLQLFNGKRSVMGYTSNSDDTVIIDYQPYVLYKPVTYLFNDCINTNDTLDNLDYTVICGNSNFNILDFNTQMAIEQDKIVIYKLYFRKLDDGNTSNVTEKCIYFTLLWNDDGTLVISCYKRVNSKMTLYKSITVEYDRTVNTDNSKIEIKCLENENEIGDLNIDLNNKTCTITSLSKLIEILVPCDGNYYDNLTFKCEPYKVLTGGSSPQSFISLYSNFSIIDDYEETDFTETFQDMIQYDYSSYKYVTFSFRVTIIYADYNYIVDIGYLVYPDKYKNGLTTFKKGGYIKNGIFSTQVGDITLIEFTTNSIKTIDFEIKDFEPEGFIFDSLEDCYNFMPNHSYNYPYSQEFFDATNYEILVKMTGIYYN